MKKFLILTFLAYSAFGGNCWEGDCSYWNRYQVRVNTPYPHFEDCDEMRPEDLAIGRDEYTYTFSGGISWWDHSHGGKRLPIQIANEPFKVHLLSIFNYKLRGGMWIEQQSYTRYEMKAQVTKVQVVKARNKAECLSASGSNVIKDNVATSVLNGFGPDFAWTSYPLATYDVNIPGAYDSLMFRIVYIKNGVQNYNCNSDTFAVRPKAYVLYNFAPESGGEPTRDADGNIVPVGIIASAKHPYETGVDLGSSATYTKNVPIRAGVLKLKAGKEYPNIGLVAIDYKNNIISNYNGKVQGVKMSTRFNEEGGSDQKQNYSYLYDYDKLDYEDELMRDYIKDRTGNGGSTFRVGSSGGRTNYLFGNYLMSQNDCAINGAFQYGNNYQIVTEYLDSSWPSWMGTMHMAQPDQSNPPLMQADDLALKFKDVNFVNGKARHIKVINKDGSESPFKFNNVGLARMRGKQALSEFEVDFYGTSNTSTGEYFKYQRTECMPFNIPDRYLAKDGSNNFKYVYDGSEGVGLTSVGGTRWGMVMPFKRCYTTVQSNEIYFVPDHFKISNFKIKNFGDETLYLNETDSSGTTRKVAKNFDLSRNDMTYLRSVGELDRSKPADMYATASFDVEVADEQGNPLVGYLKNCYARDINFKLNFIGAPDKNNPAVRGVPGLTDVNGNQMTLAQAQKAIGYFNDQAENEFIPASGGQFMLNPAYKSQTTTKVEKDAHGNPYKKYEGLFTIKADSWQFYPESTDPVTHVTTPAHTKAHVVVRLNFDRDVAKPINPFKITSDMFDVTDIVDTIYGTTLNGVAGQNPTNTYGVPSKDASGNPNPDITGASFYYGMTYSRDYNVKSSDSVDANINFAVYCGWVGGSMCDKSFIGAPGHTYEQAKTLSGMLQGWYINAKHDQTKPTSDINFGCVGRNNASGDYRCLNSSEYEMLIPNKASGGADLKFKTTTPGVRDPYLDILNVQRDEAGVVTIPLPTNPWLVYASNFVAPAGLSGTALAAAMPTSNSFKVKFYGEGFWAGKALKNDNGGDDTTGVYIAPGNLLRGQKYKKIEW
jgi:hypothetical protein